MTRSIGRPSPDCDDRHASVLARRTALLDKATGRGAGLTRPNGEETTYGGGYPANFHKGLPHDVLGNVVAPAYHALVEALTGHHEGQMETLPVGANRGGLASETDPARYTHASNEPDAAGHPLGYRKLTSPLTGHVMDTEGADAGALAISPAPLLASDELAAEMAELYVMALVRDATFSEIAVETAPANIGALVTALGGMPWFDGTAAPTDPAAARRAASRSIVTTGDDLFRGSTPGAKAGPWLSQFMLIGSDNAGADVRRMNGAKVPPNPANPDYQGLKTRIGIEDGYILYGSQVIDQRSVVARRGFDYMTNWSAWIDAQNGVEFSGLDQFLNTRRYLTTPRDLATYVHFDQLYQAYLNACLIMLADGKHFKKDRGLPETNSRTRGAFASFGGPHILSLVTEVATRALKAVWRQKWMHHRRARPEVVAALITLHAKDPLLIKDAACRTAIAALSAKIPAVILAAIADHNVEQNAKAEAVLPLNPLPADRAAPPAIADAANYLLPMAFPEGSPTHPAYGAGHATVAGACVTMLKAFFEMRDDAGASLVWPYANVFAATLKKDEGGELIPVAPLAHPLTIEGELDKLAANISIGRNMAGVHYYTDYYESLRLGERVAVSVIEEQLSLYAEPVSVSFTSFDGDAVSVVANGGAAELRVHAEDGTSVTRADWFGRYSA